MGWDLIAYFDVDQDGIEQFVVDNNLCNKYPNYDNYLYSTCHAEDDLEIRYYDSNDKLIEDDDFDYKKYSKDCRKIVKHFAEKHDIPIDFDGKFTEPYTAYNYNKKLGMHEIYTSVGVTSIRDDERFWNSRYQQMLEKK